MGAKKPSALAEYFLDIVCENLPVVKRAVAESGNVSLSDYVRNLLSKKAEAAYQKQDDLIEVVQQYAASLLGESVGKKVADDLAAFPVILTANHHGADYFSQSVQGSLIFALNSISGKSPVRTVPIFSCGNVPLNNETYPRGMLLYHTDDKHLESAPAELPIFPKKFQRQMVGVAAAFDKDMIRKAASRLGQNDFKNRFTAGFAATVHEILQNDYGSDAVLSLQSYSQQSAVLNSRIWKRLFSESVVVPDMVYLEQEKIVSALLETDLSDPKSLAWRVMWDSVLREKVLAELDGVRGCWKLEKLARRMYRDISHSAAEEMTEGTGTVFFWGTDRSGRRIPLYLESGNSDVLRGTDDSGNLWEYPYTPESVVSALKENRLIPSNFTCFLSLSFARGFTCIGAYFQAEYLPRIQQGVVNALSKTEDYRDIAACVAQTPTDSYLSGMLAVMVRTEDRCLIPAGPVEIIAGGRIDACDIAQMQSLTVRDAHIAGLFETVPAAVTTARLRQIGPPDWKKQLAKDCFRLLDGKAVRKKPNR